MRMSSTPFRRAVLFVGPFMLGSPAIAAQTADVRTPPGIAKDLIDEAARSGDPRRIMVVAETVKAVLPTFAAAIDDYALAKSASLQNNEPFLTSDDVNPPEVSTAAAADSPKDKDASDAPEEKTGGIFALDPWTGNFSAGASLATGNSENTAIGLALEASRETGDFIFSVNAYFDLGKADGVQNQQRWGAESKIYYTYTDNLTVFGRFAYDEDAFSGFDYRLFAGAGLGYFIKKSEPFTFKVKAGPGFRYSPIDDTDEIDRVIAIYSGSDLKWVVRDGITFVQALDLTWTDPTTTFESRTALDVDLWDGLTTGVSYSLRHETNPPMDRVNRDTVLRFNLGYGF